MQRKSISKKTDDDNESVSSSVNSVPDSSSNVPDTSSGHSYGLSKQERSEEKLNIASKETTIVFRLRLLVFLVLLLAAGT